MGEGEEDGEDDDLEDRVEDNEEEEDQDKVLKPLRQIEKTISKKGKQKKQKFPKFDPNNLDSILADAEQFSHLIEENDDDAGLASRVSNSDKAGKKQLAWERKREGEGGGFKGKRKGEKGNQSKGGKSKIMSSKSKPLAKKTEEELNLD